MNKYLQEAIRIGDQLIAEKETDEHGIYWLATNLKKTGDEYTVVWSKNEGLYSGMSGIIVFLATLYQQTNDKKYIETAEKAMQWTLWYCEQNKTAYYALFTGRLGVSFACLKLYSITKKSIYKDHTLDIAKPTRDALTDNGTIYDLINGISGTLLGLIHIHAQTKEPWLLEHIAAYTQKLLDGARFSKSGLYWDTSNSQIRPLCGFSHGSGGIGFVFLELAHYFKNPAFQYVAEQAFAYENAHFDQTMQNWPDFRLNLYEEADIEKAEKEYLQNHTHDITTSFDANQWCHGAAGTGLARARWYALTKNKTAREDIQKAVNRTIKKDHYSFTLCHGSGGNADLFFETFNVLGNAKILEHAKQVGDDALAQKQELKRYNSGMKYDMKKEPEDRSLFNGISGIGYFLLRLNNVKDVPSVLAPTLNQTNTEKKLPPLVQITLPQIKRHLFTNCFARTISLVDELAPGKVDAYFQKAKAKVYELEAFVTFLTQLHTTLPADKQNAFAEIFNLEYQKIAMFESSPSAGLVYIQNRIYLKKAADFEKLSDTALLKKSFQLTPLATIVHASDTSYLLRLTSTQTDELEISLFCEMVLLHFEQKQNVQSCVDAITKQYEATTKEDKALVKEKVMAQIREAVQFGILITA